jgi:hypothetical protein
VVNLIAFVFSTEPGSAGGYSAREIVVVLPYSAALAGRLLTGRLVSARLLPALTVVLLGYVLTLAHGTVKPPQLTDNQQIATWLAARHLRYGLADYWDANSVGQRSAGSGPAVAPGLRGMVGPYPWESQASWYDRKHHDANFVVLNPSYSNDQGVTYALVVATFGNPARAYRAGPYRVLVWHKNLLAGMGCKSKAALSRSEHRGRHFDAGKTSNQLWRQRPVWRPHSSCSQRRGAVRRFDRAGEGVRAMLIAFGLVLLICIMLGLIALVVLALLEATGHGGGAEAASDRTPRPHDGRSMAGSVRNGRGRLTG